MNDAKNKEDVLTKKVKEYETDIAELKDQLRNLELQFEGAVNDLGEERISKSHLEDMVESATSKRSEMEFQLQQMRIQLEQRDSEIDDKKSVEVNLHSQLSLVTKEYEFAKREIVSLETQIQFITSKPAEIVTSLSTVQNSTTFYEAVDTTKRDRDRISQQLSSEIGVKEGEVSRLMKSLSEVQEKYDVVIQSLEQSRGRETQACGDEEWMKKRISQLQTTVDLLKSEKDILVRKVNESESALECLYNEASLEKEKLNEQINYQKILIEKLHKESGSLSYTSAALQSLESKYNEVCLAKESALNDVKAFSSQLLELQKVSNSCSDAAQLFHESQTVKSKCQELESDLAEANNRQKKAKDNIQMLQEEMNRLEYDLKLKENEVSMVTVERNELLEQVEKSLTEIKILTEALAEAENIAIKLPDESSNLSELEKQIESLMLELQDRTASANKMEIQIAELINKVDSLETNREQQALELAECERLRKDMHEEIMCLESMVSSKQQSIDEYAQEIEILNKQIQETNVISDESSNEKQLLEDAKNAAEERVTELEDEINKLYELVTEYEDMIEKGQVTMKEALDTKGKLELYSNEISNELFEVKRQLEQNEMLSRETESKCQNLLKELEMKKEALTAAENELTSLRQSVKDVSETKEELVHANEAVSKLQHECDELSRKLTVSENSLIQSSSELNEKKCLLISLQNEVAEAIVIKDQRIAHLEKHKLTKEHLEMIQKLKDERKKYQEDNKTMKRQLTDLKKAYETLRDNSTANNKKSRLTSGSATEEKSVLVAQLESDLIVLQGELDASQALTASLKNKLRECSKQLQVTIMIGLYFAVLDNELFLT
jgi:chromosome segregation ATPase